MKALVVVPTYEERDNLRPLVAAVLAQDPELQVLVVDDASPDGTGKLADELAAADPRVQVLHRASKQGLGTAYRDAFRWALEKSDAEYVIQMDADFSHDPAAIAQFRDAIESCDVVVGSRYLDGMRLLNWSLWRLALSAAANRYASAVTRVPIRDLTGGFKCWRRSTLAQLALDQVRSDGYGFQIETTVQAWKLGLRVREVPIVFNDRTRGRSKLSRSIIWEALWIVWRLRFMRLPRSG